MDEVSPHDAKRYAEGRWQAEFWIASGGRLDADGPDKDEAFYNGFIDRLREEREARGIR